MLLDVGASSLDSVMGLPQRLTVEKLISAQSISYLFPDTLVFETCTLPNYANKTQSKYSRLVHSQAEVGGDVGDVALVGDPGPYWSLNTTVIVYSRTKRVLGTGT